MKEARGFTLPGHRGAALAVALASVLVASAACAGPESEAKLAPRQVIEVLAVWTGAEQQRFARVVADFETRTGDSVTYTSASSGVPQALAVRVAQGRPPDVAFLPQPGVLRQYATQNLLVPLDRTAQVLTATLAEDAPGP
jgi:alpha-glucoside transport system substrate-binding protein